MALPYHCRQLEAFVGAFGVKTSQLGDVTDLVMKAAEMFQVEPIWDDPARMAAQIEALGRKERVRRAGQYRHRGAPREKPAEVQEYLEHRHELRKGHDPHKILHDVVMAVINKGHASDLYEFPDVLAYFGARVPEQTS